MYQSKQKITLDFTRNHSIAELLGDRDRLIKLIENEYNVDIFVLGNDLEITGKNKSVQKVVKLLGELTLQINLGQKMDVQKVADSIKIMENKSSLKPHEIFNNYIIVNSGKKIKPRSPGVKLLLCNCFCSSYSTLYTSNLLFQLSIFRLHCRQILLCLCYLCVLFCFCGRGMSEVINSIFYRRIYHDVYFVSHNRLGCASEKGE